MERKSPWLTDVKRGLRVAVGPIILVLLIGLLAVAELHVRELVDESRERKLFELWLNNPQTSSHLSPSGLSSVVLPSKGQSSDD